MGWPAGLKLNKELNLFFGEFFLWLIYIWDSEFLVIANHTILTLTYRLS